MIRFNGQILDTFENTLNKLVIKKSLASVENLSDRKGTSSYTFDLPRTQLNESAFNGVTIEGALTDAFGDAEILVDNNVFQRGVLYVTGYDDEVFKCVFIGDDLDLISKLSEVRLSDAITYKNSFQFTNTFFKDLMGNTASPYRPASVFSFLNIIYFEKSRNKENLPIVTKLKFLINQVFSNLGYSLESQFINSNYFDFIYYGTWKGKHQNSIVLNGGIISPTDLKNEFDAGTIDVGTLSIEKDGNKYIVESDALNGSNFEFENFELRIKVDYTPTLDIISSNLFFEIYDNNDNLFYTSEDPTGENFLVQGRNNLLFDVQLSEKVLEGYYFKFYYKINSTITPLGDPIFDIREILIKTDFIDDIDEPNPISFMSASNYLSDVTCLDFIKGVLRDFNLVMDVEDRVVTIELQDQGIEPFTNNVMPAIYSDGGIVDITDKIENIQNINIDYLQAGKIHLFQNILPSDFTREQSPLALQEFGSTFFKINSFNEREIEEYESFFNSSNDFWDVIITYGSAYLANVFNDPPGTLGFYKKINPYENKPFENVLFYNATAPDFETNPILDDFVQGQLINFAYINNSSASSTSVQNMGTSFIFTRFSFTKDFFFKKTLELKKNNQLKTVRLFDYAGNLMSFRNKYQIKNQTYKLVSYEFDVQSKEVIAKLQLA